MNDTISPDDAERHGIILNNPYPVVDVAKIAAGCTGENHRERVIDALRLLGAAETLSDPWAFQHEPSPADKETLELERMAASIIAKATNGVRIPRRPLCVEACLSVGCGGSPDTADRHFEEWLAQAAESQARWDTARELFAKNQSPTGFDAVVDARRSKVKDKQRAAEIERFRLSFESGQNTAPRILHDIAASRRVLLGVNPDFTGFLPFLLKMSERPNPQPPRLINEDGQFVKKPRDEKGQIKSTRS